MNIYLSMLLDRFKIDNHKVIRPFFNRDPVISGIRFIENCKTNYREDILYVGNMSSLSIISYKASGIHVLCSPDQPAAIQDFEGMEIDLMVLEKDTSLNKLFEEIQDIFNYLNSWSNKLLQAVMENKGIESIINIAREVFENPINVIDSSLKLLAQTSEDKSVDSTWDLLTADGYVTHKSVPTEENKRIRQFLKKIKGPTLYTGDSLEHPTIMANININGYAAANLNIVSYYRPFRASDFLLAEFLVSILSIEIQKSEFIRNSRGIAYENLIEDLLDGKINNPKVLEERMRYLNLELGKNLFLITIIPEEGSPAKYSQAALRDKIIKQFGFEKCIIHEGRIVIIINRNKEELTKGADFKSFSIFLRENHLLGGVSTSFSNLLKLKEYYYQSNKALDLGIKLKSTEVLMDYRDYMLYHLMDICVKQENIKELIHPSIYILRKYDKENQAAFTETLYKYLVKLNNQLETAETLHIHRSTLIYRLKRIKEITGVNLEDRDTFLHLYLSLRLLEYMENCLQEDNFSI